MSRVRWPPLIADNTPCYRTCEELTSSARVLLGNAGHARSKQGLPPCGRIIARERNFFAHGWHGGGVCRGSRRGPCARRRRRRVHPPRGATAPGAARSLLLHARLDARRRRRAAGRPAAGVAAARAVRGTQSPAVLGVSPGAPPPPGHPPRHRDPAATLLPPAPPPPRPGLRRHP